jgi:tetratricopeptide (TPR) repeat protein
MERILASSESREYLDNAIQLLYHAFPNTWDQRGPQQGHGWCSWETCSAIVAHLSSLMGLQKQYNLRATNTEVFSELVFRIGTYVDANFRLDALSLTLTVGFFRYLWENEQPTTAKSFFEYGLELNIDPNSRICAQAYRLLGNIGLDVAQPRAALSAYQKALAARETLEEPNSPAIAEVYDSIACSYCEIGDVPQALEYLAKADAINFAHFDKTSARTQAIYSLAYLRGDLPDKALEALHLCWKLQNKTQEEIAESQYPKHAGDIILLARIQYALGQKEEGQRLASRSINIRSGIFGSKGPRVADSIFIVARMLAAAGEQVVAAKMYREIIEMSHDMVEMKGHLARALWFLASIEELLENPAEGERLRKDAKDERAKIQDREAPDEDTDEAFMGLVSWMLW